MTDEEFSSWFTHDGGPCPLSVGTVVIAERKKSKPGRSVQMLNPTTKLLEETSTSFTVLFIVSTKSFEPYNSWEYQYFGKLEPKSNTFVPHTLRYRIKKGKGFKLLEEIAKKPPLDLIPDPEIKLLEYHPS